MGRWAINAIIVMRKKRKKKNRIASGARSIEQIVSQEVPGQRLRIFLLAGRSGPHGPEFFRTLMVIHEVQLHDQHLRRSNDFSSTSFSHNRLAESVLLIQYLSSNFSLVPS